MIDRYNDGHTVSLGCGKYSVLENFCYANFLRYYYANLPTPIKWLSTPRTERGYNRRKS